MSRHLVVRIAGVALFLALVARSSEASRRVYLHAHVFDPLTEPPLPEDLAAFPSTLASGNGSDFFMLQTTGWTTTAWHDEIRARGGAPLGFLRHGCTIVRAAQGTMGSFDNVPTRRATVALLPAHRLTRSAIATWKDAASVPPWDDGFYRVEAMFMRDEEPAHWLASLVSRLDPGTTVEGSSGPAAGSGGHGMITLRCESEATLVEAVEELARTPGVLAVSLASRTTPSDFSSAQYHQAGPWQFPDTQSALTATSQFNQVPLYGAGLAGQGEIIGMIDTGFVSTCVLGSLPARIDQPLDPSGGPFAIDPSPGPDKVMSHYRVGAMPIFAPGHGTHMAGIAAGDEPSCLAADDAPLNPLDCGIARGLEHPHGPDLDLDGVAPGARLVLIEQFDGAGNPTTARQMHEQLYGTSPGAGLEGPRIANSSQNDRLLAPGYGSLESTLDRFSHARRDYLMVNSAGNTPSFGARLPPADMKGGVVVGAVSGSEFESVPGESVWTDVLDPATGSAHGPGDWFRVKPDVVSWSGASTKTQHFSGPCLTPANSQATSSASATTAGLAALVRQYFRSDFYPTGGSCGDFGFNPTNALLKAVLINSTRNLTGANTGDFPTPPVHSDRPTFGQGWGRPVLGDTLFLAGDPVGTGAAERTRLLVLTDTPNGLEDVGLLEGDRATRVASMRPGIRQGDVHEFDIQVRQGEDLHVTLAWTDRPSAANAADPLIADLDLEVVGPDPAGGPGLVVWRPNAGASSDVDASGNPLDRARAWSGGYTVLGPALCGDLPLGEEVSHPGWTVREYEDCTPQAACPPGEPQYRHAQRSTPPFWCFHHRDPVNTVENVFIPASVLRCGTYQVRVIGYEVPDESGLETTAHPGWIADGAADTDAIEPDWQGYALLASGRVAHERGFVHLNRQHYVCGDQLQATVVDSNFVSGSTVRIEVGSDIETVTCTILPDECAEPACPSRPIEVLGTGFTPVAENGIVELVEGARELLTATHDDTGVMSTACASTGPLLSVLTVTSSDACGDADASLEPGELIFVEASIQNASPYPIASVTAECLVGTGGSAPQAAAVLATPLPLQPGEIATLRVPVVVGAATCPGTDNVIIKLTADERSCTEEKLLFTLGLDCSYLGPNPTPPEEVPNGSVRVQKQLSAIRIEWDPPPLGADAYNVYRGSIATLSSGGPLYSHVASVVLGAGECGSLDTDFTDGNDLSEQDNYYYLVSAVTDCGLEGTLGASHVVLGGALTPFIEEPRGGGCP